MSRVVVPEKKVGACPKAGDHIINVVALAKQPRFLADLNLVFGA